MICDHLGHTEGVHDLFYRLQLDYVESTVVAQSLIASESGKLTKFKGKKLEDIIISTEEDLKTLEPEAETFVPVEIHEDQDENDENSEDQPDESERTRAAKKRRKNNVLKVKVKVSKVSSELKDLAFAFFQEEIENLKGPTKQRVQSFEATLSENLRSSLGKSQIRDLINREIKKAKKKNGE